MNSYNLVFDSWKFRKRFVWNQTCRKRKNLEVTEGEKWFFGRVIPCQHMSFIHSNYKNLFIYYTSHLIINWQFINDFCNNDDFFQDMCLPVMIYMKLRHAFHIIFSSPRNKFPGKILYACQLMLKEEFSSLNVDFW